MRSANLLILLVAVALWVLGGCATPKATTIAPTEDELPHFKQIERTLSISVGVEGRGEAPRVLLVPSFEEPELTAEERAALGEEEPGIDWLEFYVPLPKIVRTWSEIGGVRTAIRGLGGPAVGLVLSHPPQSVGGEGGVATGAHDESDTRYGKSSRSRQAVGKGPSSSVRVGVNPPSRVAGRERRRGP